MTSINKSDNMAALALLGLEKSSKVMGKAMERLSSGKRINHASDDASGLSIATKMQAHTLGVKKSIQNANAGINILKTMDASLSDTQDILLRMRELAVKSASDNNTYLDRTFIQDEVNQLTQELNKVSQNTEFNKAKLLDGTLNKKITLGGDSENTMIIDSQSIDSASIGSYKLNSVTEAQTVDRYSHVTASVIVNTSVGDSNTPFDTEGADHGFEIGDTVKYEFGGPGGIVFGLTDNGLYKIKSVPDSKKFTLMQTDGSDFIYGGAGGALDKFTRVSDTFFPGAVGSNSSAKTALDNLFHSDADYTVKGSFETKVANVEAGADARNVARAFNLISETTDVKATATTRVKISNLSDADTFSFTLQGKNSSTSKVYAIISNTNNLTDLKDAINSVSGSTGITASLSEDLANINLLQNEGYDIVIGDVFSTNSNTFQVKTVNKNNETGELIDGTVHTLGRTTSEDSIAIAGQVSLSSSKAFSVTSGNANNHFSDNVSPLQSSFSSISSINLKTHNGSNEALSVIDGALNTISKLRSVTGAKEAHLLRVINNLTNIAIGTDKAKEQIEGSNFASETSNLTVAQILSESATAMVTQATNNSKHLLQIINKE